MTWASTAPDAVDALVALAVTLKATVADLAVADGPEVSGSSASQALIIGYSDDRTDAIEHTLDEGGLVPNQNDRYVVNCRIDVLIGNTRRVSDARRDAYTLLGQYAALIYADPSLPTTASPEGVVMQALIVDPRSREMQTPRGLLTRLQFGVDCDAYTSD